MDNQDVISEKAFNPILEREIKDFILYANSTAKISAGNQGYENVYNLFLYKDENNVCYFRIITDYFYTSEGILGYAFLDGSLVVIYENLNFDLCKFDFINKDNLFTYEDSISGYVSNESNANILFEPIKREIKVVNKDSIEVTYTGGF